MLMKLKSVFKLLIKLSKDHIYDEKLPLIYYIDKIKKIKHNRT